MLEDGLNLIGEGEISAEIFVVRVAVGAAEIAVDAEHFIGRKLGVYIAEGAEHPLDAFLGRGHLPVVEADEQQDGVAHLV